MQTRLIPISFRLSVFRVAIWSLALVSLSACSSEPDEATDTPTPSPSPTGPPNLGCDVSDRVILYPDVDADGYGDDAVPVVGCTVLEGYSLTGGDCDDSNADVKPGAVELCDIQDNDCDGFVDEGFAFSTWYPDVDEDGYGDSARAFATCTFPEGHILTRADCNDSDAGVKPGAVEICDAQDNDCDGSVDEHISFYLDTDQDGYGDDAHSVEACSAPSGYVPKSGDCEDGDASVYPGATDAQGDGLDSSCDGAEGDAPSVGLPASTFTSIQAALDAASEGQTVWVGPGTYSEYAITFRGKAVALRSTAGEAQTLIDGKGLGSIFNFEDGEQADTHLEGFTIRGGIASQPCTVESSCLSYGGGIYMVNASPTLAHLTVAGCLSTQSGGGMYLLDSSPTLTLVSLVGNLSTYGGGIQLDSSDPTLIDVNLAANMAGQYGGGLCTNDSSPVMTRVTLQGNTAGFSGGGIFAWMSDVTLTQGLLSGNSVRGYGLYGEYGGGMNLESSNATLTQVAFLGNSSTIWGGGLAMQSSSATLTQAIFSGNSAQEGGGIYQAGSSLMLTQGTLIGNTANVLGGGILLTYSSSASVFKNVILAYNVPDNLDNDSTSVTLPLLSYCDLYSPPGQSNHNLSNLDSTNRELAPDFLYYSSNRDPLDDDLRLQPDSPLRDAGDPTLLDLDGSRSEIGAYGGPDADAAAYRDADQDGLYDGWEQRFLDGLTQGGADDADADGLNNLGELNAGTLPNTPDTDGDGWTDGAEVNADNNPLEASSQPGVSGVARLQVPEDFSSIQAAIDWCGYECEIAVSPGVYQESLHIDGKTVVLEGGGPTITKIVATPGQRVVTAVGSHLDLKGFTITGGHALDGGGLYFNGVSGALEALEISGNSVSGDSTHYAGGGMLLSYSSPTITQVTFLDNSAEHFGGGMYLWKSNPLLTQVTFSGNSANEGGGMYLRESNPLLTQVTFTGNSASVGGGMYFTGSSPQLHNSILAYNRATVGGNLYTYDTSGPQSSIVLSFCSLYNPPDFGTEPVTPTGTYTSLEPQFLAYADASTGAACVPGATSTCLPDDLHLALSSPLANTGDPTLKDVDGSRADIGIYGGLAGDRWDNDSDGVPDYFWPGEWEDAPQGFNSSHYDCDDRDGAIQACGVSRLRREQ